MIYCNRTCKVSRPSPKVIDVRSFKYFDSTAFVTDLQNQPWDTLYLFDNPNDAWFCMEVFLKDIGNKHAPSRLIRVHCYFMIVKITTTL